MIGSISNGRGRFFEETISSKLWSPPPKISLSNFKSNYILESRSQNVNKTRLKYLNIDFYKGKKLKRYISNV